MPLQVQLSISLDQRGTFSCYLRKYNILARNDQECKTTLLKEMLHSLKMVIIGFLLCYMHFVSDFVHDQFYETWLV